MPSIECQNKWFDERQFSLERSKLICVLSAIPREDEGFAVLNAKLESAEENREHR